MKKLLLIAALALCAAPAYAAPDRYAQMDTDANGQVDWDEFHNAVPNMKRPAFDMIDADKSGGISREEWDTFAASHGAGMMGGQKGMPPAGMTMPPAGMGKPMPPAGAEKSGMPLIQPPAQPAAPAAPSSK